MDLRWQWISVICKASSVGWVAATALSRPLLLPLPTAGGSRTAEPTPTLPATAVGRAPSGDTRLTASRDATAIESSTANEPAKIHH
jgi:hypothetical protein